MGLFVVSVENSIMLGKLALLLYVVALCKCEILYEERFDDGDAWSTRWIQSTDKPDTLGKFVRTAGKFYGDKEEDAGIQTSQDARLYKLTAKIEKPFSNEGKQLVLQYTVKHEQKPEDWDDEEDGEWEPAQINNPKFKGEWKPKMIDNPAYKGEWVHPEIDNPEYAADDSIYRYSDIGAIGFELWQVKSGTIFDNIIVADSVSDAEAHGKKYFEQTKAGEKKMKDEADAKEEEERKKREEEEKAKEKDKPKDEKDDADDEEEDDEEEKDEEPVDEDAGTEDPAEGEEPVKDEL